MYQKFKTPATKSNTTSAAAVINKVLIAKLKVLRLSCNAINPAVFFATNGHNNNVNNDNNENNSKTTEDIILYMYSI